MKKNKITEKNKQSWNENLKKARAKWESLPHHKRIKPEARLKIKR